MTDYNKALTLIEEQQKTMKKGSAPWCVGEQLKQMLDLADRMEQDGRSPEAKRYRGALHQALAALMEQAGMEQTGLKT